MSLRKLVNISTNYNILLMFSWGELTFSTRVFYCSYQSQRLHYPWPCCFSYSRPWNKENWRSAALAPLCLTSGHQNGEQTPPPQQALDPVLGPAWCRLQVCENIVLVEFFQTQGLSLNSIAALDLLKQYRHIVPSLGHIVELMPRDQLHLSISMALCTAVKSSPIDFWASCEQDSLVNLNIFQAKITTRAR